VEAGRGPTATVIVQMGTLKIGDPFICGDYSGKVKSLLDDRGKPVREAAPSMPAKVLGFTGLPNAGDELLVMDSERSAKTLSEERVVAKRTDKLTIAKRATLESLLDTAGVKEAMAGLLEPEQRETVSRHGEVKLVFNLSKGIVGGCLVTDGRIARVARARVLRRRQPVCGGGLSTLRRFQDDVKEVRPGLEC